MEILGTVTNTPLEGAVVFGFAAFGAMVPFHLVLKEHRHRILLLFVSFIGITAAMVGMAVGSTACFVAGLAILFFAVIAALFILATEPLETKVLRNRLPHALRVRRKGFAFLVGMAVLVLVGIGIGLLVGDAGDSSEATTPPTVVEGKYHVSGTCANGSCTVNECARRSACGAANEGRLREGATIDIVCQAKGRATQAPNGRESAIWDRLANSLYVSDLFVSGTAVGKFTSALPRCTG